MERILFMRTARAWVFMKIAIFALIMMVLFSVVNFVFVPTRVYTRLMMHELYHQDEPIDLFFVGASRYYRGLNPEVFDERLGMNSFNAGSSAQGIVDAYYILKEVFKKNAPKIVVLDMNWKKFGARETVKQSELIFDYYRMSPNKLMYLRDAFDVDDYLRALVPGLQYADGEALLNGGGMIRNIKNKLSPDYARYAYSTAAYGDEWYAGKGFIYSTVAYRDRGIGRLELPPTWNEGHIWDGERIDEGMVAFLEKTIQLCRENGAIPILLSTPSPLPVMSMFGNYGAYSAYVSDFAARNDVNFFDFELIRGDVFEKRGEYFFDSVHLSGEGANVFSRCLADFLAEYMDGTLNVDAYLYPSFDEMMRSEDFVFNTWMEIDDAAGTVQAFANAGTDVVPEYEFLYKGQGDAEFAVFRPYDRLPTAQLPEWESGSVLIRVNARAVGSDADLEQYDEVTCAVG